MAEVDILPRLLQKRTRLLQHGQRLEAEEVELHQPRLLDPFHVELGHEHVGARIAVERHQFDQRPVADDDTRGVGGGVAIQPFQLLRRIEKLLHDRLAVAGLLELGLAFDGLGERHRVRRIVRHHLAEPVHLPVRHLQNAAHVAQDGARLQLSVGDDLRDPVRAVFLADIGDDLVAPVLAEIDVEVRHRHALGVQEALEEKAEADRIEVGDGQRPRHDRACAGAAAGADGDALRLRPLDEVGHNQEVARKLHPGDDVEFEGEALFVILFASGAQMFRDGGEAADEPRFGLRFQLGGFSRSRVLRAWNEARQDRLARTRPERAALGDLDRVLNRLRQIGEQRRHFALRLEVMIGREATPVVFGDVAPFRDAQKRVVRVENIAVREVGFVCGDEGRAIVVGPAQELGLDRALSRQAVPLDLDIKALAEDRRERGQALTGERRISGGERFVRRAVGAARKRDQPLGAFLKLRQRHMRRAFRRVVEECPARKPHQVRVSRRVLRQQYDRAVVGRARPRTRRLIGGVRESDRQRASDDRLHPFSRERFRKFERAEEVVAVGDGERGLTIGGGPFRQPLDRQRAFQQRIGGMEVKMDKGRLRHQLPQDRLSRGRA